jgi:fructoselysine-6-P-deglycase FrlB-like protein
LGKPYNTELYALANTYQWALSESVEYLAHALAGAASIPLLTVGSGGSLTAAHFAASLHQCHAGRLAKAVTPLETVSTIADLHDTAVMILSAGGRNPDIISALKKVVCCEPRRVIVICSKPASPLMRLAEEYRSVDVITFKLPSGKDGFLATNSLLAFSVLLVRAYAAAYSINISLPTEIETLVHPGWTQDEFTDALRNQCQPLWDRENLTVLFGPQTQAAAFDIESKFIEAALGAVQTSDYRNFAHGRHHWLAKRGDSTGVLGFVTGEDTEIAEKTLRLLPPNVPAMRLRVPGEGVMAGLAAMVCTLHMVGLVGEARGIDPGRPGVPEFGRKIYNLRTYGRRNGIDSCSVQTVSIERKTGTSINKLRERGDLQFWENAYQNFTNHINSASFGAIVCDYDGTLCEERDRFTGLGKEVASQLARLLSEGIILGVATGRGKSVKDVLRTSLPDKHWGQVFVGYYNCADIGALGDDARPDGTDEVCEALLQLARDLRTDYVINRNSDCTFRPMQITVVPNTPAVKDAVWHSVQQLVHRTDVPGVSLLSSTHSFDVIAPGVTKRRLIQHIGVILGSDGEHSVLCIGDRGQFPGNDFDLLQEPFSLSVDETSTDPLSCWNLAPRGYRGAQAAAHYLRSLRRNGEGGVSYFLD